MSDPRSYPADQGPFDPSGATPEGEKTFTADDPAAPDAVQYDADTQDADSVAAESRDLDHPDGGLDPLELGDETDVDPDLGISN